MTESLGVGLLFVVLFGSTALGLFVRPFLSEVHRSRETTDFVQLVVTMLVTFVAVFLGLSTSSAKATGLFANGVTRRRHQLREYTAAVIAGTWHQKAKISGDDIRGNTPPAVSGSIGSPVLGDMLSRVELDSAALSQRIRCSG